MSQRKRIVLAAAGLAAALFLVAPAPSRAVAVREGTSSATDVLDRVWRWLAELWPQGAAPGLAGRPEREGGAAGPNGQPALKTAPPPPGATEGGAVDPNGGR